MSLTHNLAPFQGEIYLAKQFYPLTLAEQYFKQLLTELEWQEESIFIFGRWVKVPRLMCWYGDKDAHYKYSQLEHKPLPWTNTLQLLKQDLENVGNFHFNSVLANLYRDGSDSMGCHADNEPELGENPVIASLSFGDSRLLKFRHKHSKHVLDLVLENGDLLIMAAQCQHYWLHQIPKTRKQKTARINLTFRNVQADNPAITDNLRVDTCIREDEAGL
jgi:alkylated DNA repair dioxygenase AlkB